MLLSFYLWLGSLMRGQMFMTWDGNDDWRDLVNPEKYGLTHTQNIYFRDEAFSEGDKVGGWWIRPVPKEDEIIEEEEEEKPSDKYTKQLHDVGKLGPDDTVFVLLHGNAKVSFLNSLCGFFWPPVYI